MCCVWVRICECLQVKTISMYYFLFALGIATHVCLIQCTVYPENLAKNKFGNSVIVVGMAKLKIPPIFVRAAHVRNKRAILLPN